MNKFIVGMIFTMSFSAFAQNATETIVDVNPQQQGAIQVINEPATTQTVTTNVDQQAPVVIQNQPQIQVQRQATTIVEDSPLSESSADRLRRQRVELEQRVESQIVEKLEQDRMKSERERLDKLFIQQQNNANVQIQQNSIQQENSNIIQDSQIIAPVQIVNPQESISPVDEKKLDEPAAVIVAAKIIEEKIEEKKDKTYVSFDFGFINYTSADNIDTSGAMGFTVGQTFDEKFIVEGGFSYSRAEIEAVNRPYVIGFGPYSTTYYTTLTEMEQYDFNGSFKYRVLKGKFSPIIGGGLSYVYRSYEDTQYFDYKLTAESTAVDAAFILGGEVKLSEKMIISAEYRYSMNVFYDISLDDGRLQSSKMWGDSLAEPVEEIGYSNFLIGLKYVF